MCEIKKFFDDAKAKLEKPDYIIADAGNKPHHPAVFISNATDEEMRKVVCSKIKTIWPRAVSRMPFLSYTSDPDGTFIWKNQKGEELSSDDIGLIFDDLYKATDIFKDMKNVNIYNIIQTSKFSCTNDFLSAYEAARRLSENINNVNMMVMDIVFLDGTNKGRILAAEIKETVSELWEKNPHNGALILSNRMYRNGMCSEEIIFKIIGSVVVLSNNDDGNLDNRNGKLYESRINTVSYLSFEKPEKDIAYVIINYILRENFSALNAHLRDELSADDVRSKLEMSPQLKLSEEYLKGMGDSAVNGMLKLLEHVPVKPNTKLKEGKITPNITWKHLNEISYPKILEKIFEDFTKNELGGATNIAECLNAFDALITNKLSVTELSSLKENVVEEVFPTEDIGQCDENDLLGGYVGRHLKKSIQSEVLYPAFQERLKKLREDAKSTIKDFQRFYDEFCASVSGGGLGEMTTIYEDVTKCYLEGKLHRKLVVPGNGKKEFCSILLEIISGIVASNKELFSMSLAQYMQKKAQKQGPDKFIAISNELKDRGDSNINIWGLYPIEKSLEVFMLQTEINGVNEKSELYDYLSGAFGTESQYFNTSRDDSLEIIRFYDCSQGKMNRL